MIDPSDLARLPGEPAAPVLDGLLATLRAMACDEQADPETRRAAIHSLLRLRAELAMLVPGAIRLLVKAVYRGEFRCGTLPLDSAVARSRLVETGLLTAPELARLSEAAALALAQQRFARWRQTGEPPG